MDIKIGKRYRIKQIDRSYPPDRWNMETMPRWIGHVVTVKDFHLDNRVKIVEDMEENDGRGWFWNRSDFQLLAEWDE